MIRRPPRSTRTDTLFPYTTLFRSVALGDKRIVLVDGVATGGVNRLPKAGEIRSNLAVGGKGEATAHTPRERSEEHTSELQSLMRISYAVFCLKKKNKNKHITRGQ